MSRERKIFTPKKLLLDTHVYSNLLCAGYLIIYGLSSLAYNHEIVPKQSQLTWSRSVEISPDSSDLTLAESVRDELGLIGWVPKWRIRRLDAGKLRFLVARPAKTYEIRLDQVRGKIEVVETRTGILGAIKGLHGLSSLPGSTWAFTWGIYTEVSVLALLYAVISGFLIWWQHATARHQKWILLLSVSGTLLLMISIVW